MKTRNKLMMLVAGLMLLTSAGVVFAVPYGSHYSSIGDLRPQYRALGYHQPDSSLGYTSVASLTHEEDSRSLSAPFNPYGRNSNRGFRQWMWDDEPTPEPTPEPEPEPEEEPIEEMVVEGRRYRSETYDRYWLPWLFRGDITRTMVESLETVASSKKRGESEAERRAKCNRYVDNAVIGCIGLMAGSAGVIGAMCLKIKLPLNIPLPPHIKVLKYACVFAASGTVAVANRICDRAGEIVRREECASESG